MAVTRTHFTFASIRGPLSAVLRFGNPPAMINAGVHSGEDAILTAAGPESDRVRGQMGNTEVFGVMAEALGLSLSD
jgi:alkaline phosphatase